MPDDLKNMQLQIHLAEYSNLRSELLSLIKWRDSLVFISLGITGTIFSFVFSQPIEKPLTISSRWLALYLVAPLSTLVGGLWMVNGWRISRIGKYLQDIIAVKINIILNSFVSINGLQPKIQTLEWESSNQRLKYKWQRRSIEWFIYLMTFVFSGFLSQILLLKDKNGSIIIQISQLEFPVIYIINTIMLLFAFTGFMVYLFKGFQYKIKSQIHFPE